MSTRPMALSWSALETWTKCRQKDYLRRNGAKGLSMSDIRTFFPGTVADRVMRRRLELDLPGSMPDMVREVVDEEEKRALETGDGVVKWTGPKDRENVITRVTRAVIALEPILMERVVPFSYIPEFRFEVPLRIPSLDGGTTLVRLIGGMDIHITDAPEPADRTWYDVLDLKLTENTSYARTKKGQLTFYDLVCQALFGQTCRNVAIVQPLIADRMIHEFEITDADRQLILHSMVEMAHSRMRGDIETAEDPNACYKCDVQHACPKFRVARRGGT